MKKAITVISFTTLFYMCQPAPMHPDNPRHEDPVHIASFEIYHGDTCNRTDINGKKQGKWFKFSGGKIQDTTYYKDNKELSE